MSTSSASAPPRVTRSERTAPVAERERKREQKRQRRCPSRRFNAGWAASAAPPPPRTWKASVGRPPYDHRTAPLKAPTPLRRADVSQAPSARRASTAGAVLNAVLDHGPVARSTVAPLTGPS